MAADPDFLSLVEKDRLKPQKGIASAKAKRRETEKKHAFLNENVCLRLVSPPVTSERGNDAPSGTATTWNIPRFRLTETFLQEVVNRGRVESSPTLVVSHLQEQTTKTVILPKDLNLCRSSPTIYDVHTNLAVGVSKGGVLASAGDSFYTGDVIFHIGNIPALSTSEQYAVVPDDVHRYLIEGAISGIEEIQIQTTSVEKLRKTLAQLEKDSSSVHSSPIYNEGGRALVGSPLKEAREAKASFLDEEKKRTEARLKKAVAALEAERARHFSACSLRITERSEKDQNGKDGKVSFAVKVMGKKKEKEHYTTLIAEKSDDWSLVPFYATGDVETMGKSKHNSSKGGIVMSIGEADQVAHFVDVGRVSIEMLADGFGVLECVSSETEGARSQHRVFHGHFCEGQYHHGTLHTDAGVFTGTFQSNEPCKGKLKYADGTVLTGDFALCGEDSPLGPNPYRRGLPSGHSSIQWKDGSSYEGEMRDGTITGRGVYRYPQSKTSGKSSKKKQESTSFAEMRGDFVNGTLRNNGGAEGERGSNLRRSLLFGGERLWGP
ncbi:hypothetical protein ACHAXT_009566 [Thalassiosira profunda]